MKGVKSVLTCIGEKFGRWTVLEYIGSDASYRSMVKAKCDCGTYRNVRLSELRYGASTSCGCYNREIVALTATKHGFSKTPIYMVWIAMRDRCYNSNNENYIHYGGRGIAVCDEWNIDFLVFMNWCLSNGWKKGLEIDRIDNAGIYSPNNCRIVTEAINSRNKRSNVFLTINGETKVIMDWCKQFGFNHNTISRRVKKGWPIEKIFIPATHKNRIVK